MQIARALTLLAIAFSNSRSSASAVEPHTYMVELMPPPPAFLERMGGLPKEITPQTFHAPYGTFTIHTYDGTTLVFDFHGLLPDGV